MNRHSIISLSVIIALSCGSVNAFASNFMTMDEKATAIQSIRNEANQAMEDKQAALKAYNADRSPENMARLGDIENSLRTAGDRINAVQATEMAPDAPRPVTQRAPQLLQQKTPHITGTTYRNAVISMQQVTTGPALPAGTAVNPLTPPKRLQWLRHKSQAQLTAPQWCLCSKRQQDQPYPLARRLLRPRLLILQPPRKHLITLQVLP